MGHMTVCPDDLRFTQDSIKNTFRHPYHDLRLDHAVDLIRKKLLSADDFPALKVVQHGGILWSLDNRRLWVFRKARVTVIEVSLVSVDYSPRSAEFFKNLVPSLKRHYSSPAFYPRVWGHVGSIPVESPISARGEGHVPKLAQDIRKFSEAEHVGVSESNTNFGANRPPVAAAQNLKHDTNGRVHGQEGFAESGGCKGRVHGLEGFAECGGSKGRAQGQEGFGESGGSRVWETLQIGIAVAGIGWGIFRLLHKFM